MDELISIIIPTFNRPERLARAIRSALNQRYDNFEIIVVDDSSDHDLAAEVVKGFNDNRVTYFINSHKKGANGARNSGILEASGNYVAFLDDDDEWMPNKLRWQMDYLNAHPEMHGVFSAYEIRLKKSWKVRRYKIASLAISQVLLNKVSVGSSSNLLFRADVFKMVGLWDEDMFRQQDLELLVRVLSSKKIGYDEHIVMKVDGRNNPEPKRAFIGQEIYYNKVAAYLNLLGKKNRDKFHSNHFRRLSGYRIQLKQFDEAFLLYKRALRYQLLNPRKDINNVYLLMKGLAK